MDGKVIAERLNGLFKTETFACDFFDNIDDKGKIKELLTKNDIELSDEELSSLIDYAKSVSSKESKEELSEDDMDNVTGGFGLLTWTAIGVGSAIFFGYQTHKARKELNRATNACYD